ncbi:MAG TPA: HlyD family efflux transporter periplasmic adaptor subunit, partial [Gemmatimonadales bacterium]|nr:HlyD family efflux transporter periplasmic adaptor subunit [Gemmatimonadales bacterium]
MSRRRWGALAGMVLSAGAGACAREPEPDAYGNFEAIEVVVSAEEGGRLLSFTVHEGARLDAGAAVGIIDTTPLALERDQAEAQQEAVASRTIEADRQIAVLEAQLGVARRSFERARRLHAQQAATAQQLDQAEREYRVLERQIAAARAQRRTATQEAAAAGARVAQIEDRIGRGTIVNPRAGVVLASHVEEGETVRAGQPLYRIADLDTLELRAYISGDQIGALRLGSPAEVTIDSGEGVRTTLAG